MDERQKEKKRVLTAITDIQSLPSAVNRVSSISSPPCGLLVDSRRCKTSNVELCLRRLESQATSKWFDDLDKRTIHAQFMNYQISIEECLLENLRWSLTSSTLPLKPIFNLTEIFPYSSIDVALPLFFSGHLNESTILNLQQQLFHRLASISIFSSNVNHRFDVANDALVDNVERARYSIILFYHVSTIRKQRG